MSEDPTNFKHYTDPTQSKTKLNPTVGLLGIVRNVVCQTGVNGINDYISLQSSVQCLLLRTMCLVAYNLT